MSRAPIDQRRRKAKPKVVFVCDQPGWAYGIVSQNLALLLRRHFRVEVIYQTPADRFAGQINDEADVWIFHHITVAAKYPKDRCLIKLSGNRSLGAYDEARIAAMLGGKHLVVLNDSLAEVANKYTPHITYIPNGLDVEQFKPRPKPADSPFVVAFCANVDQPVRSIYKGFPYVAVACDELGVDLKTSSYRADKGEPETPYSQMPQFYNSASCLVHPSAGEGSSNAVMEALASGIPVISTKTGFHGEKMTDGHNVLFVERSLPQIREAIDFLRQSPSECRRIGENGRQFALAHHDLRKLAPKWTDAITKVLEEG